MQQRLRKNIRPLPYRPVGELDRLDGIGVGRVDGIAVKTTIYRQRFAGVLDPDGEILICAAVLLDKEFDIVCSYAFAEANDVAPISPCLAFLDDIVPVAATEEIDVVAGAAKQLIIARAAIKNIVAGTRVDDVVAGPAGQGVAAVIPGNIVVECAAAYDRTGLVGIGVIYARFRRPDVQQRLRKNIRPLPYRPVGELDRLDGIGVGRVDGIAVKTTIYRQRFAGVLDPDGEILICAAVLLDKEFDIVCSYAFAEANDVAPISPCLAFLDDIVPVAATEEIDVVAGAAKQLIIARAAVQEIVAIVAVERVVAIAAMEEISDGGSVYRIV